VSLDLPAGSCQNDCTLGIFVPRSTNLLSISSLPALRRTAGTFDVLVDTRVPCTAASSVQLRFANAVTYVNCAGDCNADGEVGIDELVLGVGEALGEQSLGECAAYDTNSDGTVSISELLQSVRAALQGCPG
jgi:hypothetical protein